MKKLIAAAGIFALWAASARAGETLGKDVKEISVKNEEIFIINNHKPYFWMACFSDCVDSLNGVESIKVGDTLNHKGRKFYVGIIRYIEHREEVGSHYNKLARGNAGCVFATVDTDKYQSKMIHPHKADCIIAADETQLPVSGKCNNTWMVVEGCVVTAE